MIKHSPIAVVALICGLIGSVSCDENEFEIPERTVLPAGTVVWAPDVTPSEREVIANLVGNMVKVEACDFYMGAQTRSAALPNYFPYFKDTDTAKWVGPMLTVTMPDFFIGRYEITQGEWEAVMDTVPTGSYCKVESLKWTAPWYKETGKGDRVAAYNISYDDAQRFVAALSRKTGLPFRLPTEAEWECAARGGRYSLGYKFSGSDVWKDVAWCASNAMAQGLGVPGYGVHEVGELPGNELGLHDMCGNVAEWVANSYYKYDPADTDNPQGAYGGDTLILRGGSWTQKQYTDFSPAQRKKFIVSSYHKDDGSRSESFYNAIAYTGFRIALSVK